MTGDGATVAHICAMRTESVYRIQMSVTQEVSEKSTIKLFHKTTVFFFFILIRPPKSIQAVELSKQLIKSPNLDHYANLPLLDYESPPALIMAQ